MNIQVFSKILDLAFLGHDVKTEPASGTTVNGVKADSLQGNLLSTIAGPWGETFFVSIVVT